MELHILQITFCMLSIHYSLQCMYVVQFMQAVYIYPVDAPSSQFKFKFSSFKQPYHN